MRWSLYARWLLVASLALWLWLVVGFFLWPRLAGPGRLAGFCYAIRAPVVLLHPDGSVECREH